MLENVKNQLWAGGPNDWPPFIWSMEKYPNFLAR